MPMGDEEDKVQLLESNSIKPKRVYSSRELVGVYKVKFGMQNRCSPREELNELKSRQYTDVDLLLCL